MREWARPIGMRSSATAVTSSSRRVREPSWQLNWECRTASTWLFSGLPLCLALSLRGRLGQPSAPTAGASSTREICGPGTLEALLFERRCPPSAAAHPGRHPCRKCPHGAGFFSTVPYCRHYQVQQARGRACGPCLGALRSPCQFLPFILSLLMRTAPEIDLDGRNGWD